LVKIKLVDSKGHRPRTGANVVRPHYQRAGNEARTRDPQLGKSFTDFLVKLDNGEKWLKDIQRFVKRVLPLGHVYAMACTVQFALAFFYKFAFATANSGLQVGLGHLLTHKR